MYIIQIQSKSINICGDVYENVEKNAVENTMENAFGSSITENGDPIPKKKKRRGELDGGECCLHSWCLRWGLAFVSRVFSLPTPQKRGPWRGRVRLSLFVPSSGFCSRSTGFSPPTTK